jgi:hypothetical protein
MDRSQNTGSDIDEILKNSYILLRQGNFPEARILLGKALPLDFDKEEVISALKSVGYWEDRKSKMEAMQEDTEKGEFLFAQWENYLSFLQRCGSVCEDIHYPVKQWVFSQALTCFQSSVVKKGKHDPELLCYVGRAYKGIGDYEHAVEYFEAANHQKLDDPELLAELADAYAFLNEIKASKAFFREAFFIDPQRVRLDYLESMLISRLIDEVRKKWSSEEEIKEWIPVYGNIYNVFNVKRELKPLEFGKLKQAIFQYENSVVNSGKNRTGDSDYQTVPRLINKYFWLIDHLLYTKSERKKIDEILEKIKKIDTDIYEKLIQ